MIAPSVQQFRRFDLFAFTFSSTVTLGVVFLPYVADGEIRSAWLKLLVTAIPYFILVWLIAKYSDKYGDEDFFLALEHQFGKYLYYPVVLYFILSAVVANMKVSQELSYLVNTFLLINTPTLMIILPFLCLVGLAVYYGIGTITRFVTFFVLAEIVLVLSFTVYAIFSDYFQWINIPPVFSVSVPSFLISSLSDMARYGGIVTLLGFIHFVKKEKGTLTAMSLGVFLVMIIYVLISIATLGVFGFENTIHLVSPITSLVQSVSPVNGMLERLDLLFLGFWILSFVKVSCILLWFAVYIAENCFKRVSRIIFIVFFTSAALIYSVFVPYILIGEWRVYNINVFIVSFIVPTILLLMLIVKRQKEKGFSS